MKILIPAAGDGSRFRERGYTFPKLIIDVAGQPMIQRVVQNLPFNPEEDQFIFIVREEHAEKYALRDVFAHITQGCFEVVTVDHLTEGAACTALLAREFIDHEEELLIANSDQYMKYSIANFNTLRRFTNFDGVVFTFNSNHPKWSFVACSDKGLVKEVAEKKPISNIATCGVYYYRHGNDFVSCAEQMIAANRRVKNEFYIAPVYSEMLTEKKAIAPFFVEEMWGLGTPEDLEVFLRHAVHSVVESNRL